MGVIFVCVDVGPSKTDAINSLAVTLAKKELLVDFITEHQEIIGGAVTALEYADYFCTTAEVEGVVRRLYGSDGSRLHFLGDKNIFKGWLDFRNCCGWLELTERQGYPP